MHPYYEKNKKKYNKDIYKLLSYIKDEVTETFDLDFETVVKTVQDTFVKMDNALVGLICPSFALCAICLKE